MPFDPFGDFDTRGYLRNSKSYRTSSAVKRFEHREHYANVQSAYDNIARTDPIDYSAILDTHGILFGTVYPWAGQDRALLTRRGEIPNLNIRKGPVVFAPPNEVRIAADYGLKLGNDQAGRPELPAP